MKKKYKRIKELGIILIFTYLIATSILEYLATEEAGYLIVPGILLLAILSELTSRFFGVDQRKGRK